MAQRKIGPVLLGASGKVGRALRAVWPDGVDLLCQYRGFGPSGGLLWDMLDAPAPDLPHPVSGIVAMMGVTHGDARALQANTRLALAACDLAERAGGLRVLLASTQAVYGPRRDVLHERSPCYPRSDYGRAKLAMEQAVAGRPNVTCLRIGNVMGCDGLSAAMARGPVGLERFADGTGPARMMIGPADFAQTLLALLAHEGPLPPVLNVAAYPIIAMQDLLVAAGADWHWDVAAQGGLPALRLDLTVLGTCVPLIQTCADGLVAQARAAGWEVARS